MPDWQIAAGDGERAYPDLCIKWSVILDGPGDLGPWPECQQPLKDRGTTPQMLGELRRFCEEVADGDRVVLRVGLGRVYAVGRVQGGYLWNPVFGDVDGWRIQHVRRVRWHWIASEGKPRLFAGNPMKIGTTQRLDAPEVLAWMDQLPEPVTSEPLPPLPSATGNIELPGLMESLFFHGLAATSLSELQSKVSDIIQLSRWYDDRQEDPSESETVSHLVMPLLRALGWSAQFAAVEWQKVDIALFRRLPRDNDALDTIVEVKKRGSALTRALEQAHGYACVPGRENCRRIVLTDGIRYSVFNKNRDGLWPNTPNAYLNLTRLMADYPVLGCDGATSAFLMLSRDWEDRPFSAITKRLKANHVSWSG